MADIFLSYSSKNRDFILRLKQDLERMHYSTWMDNQAIKGGDDWVKEIDENLRSCSIFLVAVSKDSNASNWVRREAIHAEKLRKKRIPLLLDDSEMPFHLGELHYVDFRNWRGYSTWKPALQKLDAVLKQSMHIEQQHDHNDNLPPRKPASDVAQESSSGSSFFGSFFSGLWRTLSGSGGTRSDTAEVAADYAAASPAHEQGTATSTHSLPSSPPPKTKKQIMESPSSFGAAVASHRKKRRGIQTVDDIPPNDDNSPFKKRKSASTSRMACGKCKDRLTKDHFSSKQWEKGKHLAQQKQSSSADNSSSKKRRANIIFCRRCEEEELIKQKLAPQLRKQCTRLHVSKVGRTCSKFLAAIVPSEAAAAAERPLEEDNNDSSNNTTTTPSCTFSSSFLPEDVTLDGYTRADWSLASNTTGWQTTTVVAVVRADSMSDFLQFLKQYKKAAYGRFILSQHNQKTDGFLCIPFDQPTITTTIDNNHDDDTTTDASSAPKKEKHIEVLCKYALGLGLAAEEKGKVIVPNVVPVRATTSGKAATTTTTTTSNITTTSTDINMDSCYSPERNPEEDYVSSSMLGSLLAAQRKTDRLLEMVPKNSVRQANPNTSYLQENDIFQTADEY